MEGLPDRSAAMWRTPLLQYSQQSAPKAHGMTCLSRSNFDKACHAQGRIVPLQKTCRITIKKAGHIHSVFQSGSKQS
jgi:hypothetical protein